LEAIERVLLEATETAKSRFEETMLAAGSEFCRIWSDRISPDPQMDGAAGRIGTVDLNNFVPRKISGSAWAIPQHSTRGDGFASASPDLAPSPGGRSPSQ
jgi:hypothetical protein